MKVFMTRKTGPNSNNTAHRNNRFSAVASKGQSEKETLQLEKRVFDTPDVEFIKCVEEAYQDRADWTLHVFQFVTAEMVYEMTEQTVFRNMGRQ